MMTKTVSQKFFIKPNYRLLVLNAPESFLKTRLIDLPEKVEFVSDLKSSPDIIIQFSTSLSHLGSVLANLPPCQIKSSYLWICYPKGGEKAAILTDLNRDIIWTIMVKAGFRAVHQMSIDEVWSAVRFRVENSPHPQQIV